MNISRPLIGAAALLVLLTGCASEAPEPIAEPPVVVKTPTPTPTPTPEPTKPALDELVLTTEGLGYLVPGQPIEEVADDVAIVIFDENACRGLVGYEQDFDRWVSNYPEGDEAFYVFTNMGKKDGALLTIVSRTEALRTDTGLGVGSTVDELTAAYPELRTVPKEGFTIYIVDGEKGKLQFEVQDDEDGSDAVDFVTVVSRDAGDQGIARSGAGGTCAS